MRSTLLGLVILFAIAIWAALEAIPNTILLINLVGIAFVFGGTISAAILTFGITNTTRTFFTVLVLAITRDKDKPIQAVQTIVAIAERLEKNAESLADIRKEKHHPFILDGLRLLENGFKTERIEEIMQTDLILRKERNLHQVEIFKTLAKYPPAFGMTGTVLGLVGLLNSLSANSGAENIIGKSMGMALVATFYGLFLSNCFFIPVSDNILHRMTDEVRFRTIIIQGMILISQKEEPLFLRELLLVHLSPKERKDLINV